MSSNKMNGKYKLVIFDMDGLMFETGRLAYEAYLCSARYYGYEMIHNVYYTLTGMTNNDIIEKMKVLYGAEHNVALWRNKMLEEKKSILERQQRVYKKKGLVELLNFIKTNDLICALASSSKREVIQQYLDIEGLNDKFDYIIAGDEVHNGKPSPEIFLLCCEKANIKPSETLVLEDSIVGITSANAGQIDCCLLHDDITDMPIFKGEIPLRKDLTNLSKENIKPTYERDSLFDVINIINH